MELEHYCPSNCLATLFHLYSEVANSSADELDPLALAHDDLVLSNVTDTNSTK